LKQKARRGALFLGVAAGYMKSGRDRIDMDPDVRVQEALRLVFSKFAEFRSARQVHLWLREEGVLLPAMSRRSETPGVVWKLPIYNSVHNILTNPIYAGAYAFGRTESHITVVEGRKTIRRGVRRPIAEWAVLLKDRHEGYITWDEFEHNQRLIADNATGMGRTIARGAVRQGEVLLAGLLRCGHCGRKLQVHYSGKLGRYNCYGARLNHGTARCISLGNRIADAAVSTEVLRVLTPLGVDAALKVLDAKTSETSAAERQLELALAQARYEAAHARRQYDAVDPANRLVAGELERRWNEALATVLRADAEIAAAIARRKPPLGEAERKELMTLGADLARAWSHPAATAATRKRILRTALHEIVVKKQGADIELILHWQGGDHTALQMQIRLNTAGRHHSRVPEDMVALVRELARLMPDAKIARLLNRCGKPTGHGNGWTEKRVRGFRGHHEIAMHRAEEWAERGEITLDAAAKIIGVRKMTALRKSKRGDLKVRQPCPEAPWVINAADAAAFAGNKPRRRPVTVNPDQAALDFQ
jgi:hypothetical protein